MAPIPPQLAAEAGPNKIHAPKAEAVRLVVIENKYKTEDGYSGHVYDVQSATKDGVVYSSLDPSIFELKYPNTDIEARAIGDSVGNQL